MNLITIGVASSPCCSGVIVLSASEVAYNIPVCTMCTRPIPQEDMPRCHLGWTLISKPEKVHLGIIKNEDLANISRQMVEEEDDTTICGVLMMAYNSIGVNDAKLRENIKRAVIYGRRMNQALEEYYETGIDRKTKKPREDVDKETKDKFKFLFQERSTNNE